MMVYGGKCCITGCTVGAVLEGVHIDSYYGDTSDNLQNGLLMRADLHTLLDKNLMAIDPITKKSTSRLRFLDGRNTPFYTE